MPVTLDQFVDFTEVKIPRYGGWGEGEGRGGEGREGRGGTEGALVRK